MAIAFGPYSPARYAGNLLFVAGQVGVDPKTKAAPKDIAGQTVIALKNLERVLAEAGANLDDVVKTTIFLTNMDDFEVMNEVYEQRFNTPRPARSTMAVHELPRVGWDVKILIEIEAIAYKVAT